MKDERSCPGWYWVRGLHDAQILEVSMQDDTLTLCIDSGNAMFDNTLERITFLGARPKTPLPEPTKKQPVYWLSDELIALPFDQWKKNAPRAAGYHFPERKNKSPGKTGRGLGGHR